MISRLENKTLKYMSDPNFLGESPDYVKMLVLFEEIDRLCLMHMASSVFIDFSNKNESLPNDVQEIIDELVSPANRIALKEWYKGRSMNEEAKIFKDYLDSLIVDYEQENETRCPCPRGFTRPENAEHRPGIRE